ncbi:S24 family peptidase [Actinoplanes subglobosus]|uniref:S24 family peptidase n=1 Tax=Actinoplanes subglobosus TaxID=1547892 RepID=A0ABV8IRQ8_9ACTN
MAAVLAMAAIGTWAAMTKQVTYIRTYGVSMNPVYYEGDLVFVRKSESYEVGQIAAYHGVGGVQVLHRIIGGDARNGFVFKGDNNDSTDEVYPTAEELIGRAVLHVPHGGTWLQPVLSPTGLGMIGFLFVSGGAVTAKSRRDIPRGRRKKKVKGMSAGGGSWATAAAMVKAVSRLHPALRTLAVFVVISGMTGLFLGFLGWMKPVEEATPTSGKSGENLAFSYSAEVPRSAAYDGTTVYSPDPIFRKLAHLVDLHLSYRGQPGRIQVDARLASQNGWHKTVQLSQQKQFATVQYTDTVGLDLNMLQQIATDAGLAIGADMGAITVTVTAQVEHGDGTSFKPAISLNLTPLQLTLAGVPDSLNVDSSSVNSGSTHQARQIGAFGYDLLTAADARRYAVYLLLVALIGAGIIATMALRHVPLRTRTQIQRRYPHMLVPVEPMASPPGKPVVIVDTFPALVKLAEKYGQMILTWTRPDGADDFVVRDEGILYRYRIEPPPAPVIPVRSASQQAEESRAGEVVTESMPVPVLQLPPAPEPPPDLEAEPDSTSTSDEPAAVEGEPAKKAAPRKRASRTTAAKTAAAKTAAAKAAPTKRTATKAPAKRTRAQAKPTTQPETTEVSLDTADQPTPAGSDTESVAVNGSDIGEQPVTAEGGGTTESRDVPEAIVDSVTEATLTAPDEQLSEPKTAEAPEAKSDSVQPEPEAEGAEAGGTEPETPKVEGVEVQAPDAEAQPVETAETSESTAADAEPETVATVQAPAVSAVAPKPTRSQKRASRRKSRSRKATQPAVDAPTIDRPDLTSENAADVISEHPHPGARHENTEPAEQAREAMTDLADRNRPIAAPEPEPAREPIYDFLPAAKRAPVKPDSDDDTDEV